MLSVPHARTTLPNGLEVIVHEDHRMPLVAVNVWYHVGSKNERPGLTGLAHLFEHLMFEGSAHQPDSYFAPLQEADPMDSFLITISLIIVRKKPGGIKLTLV